MVWSKACCALRYSDRTGKMFSLTKRSDQTSIHAERAADLFNWHVES